jgi:hypothetical protein
MKGETMKRSTIVRGALWVVGATAIVTFAFSIASAVDPAPGGGCCGSTQTIGESVEGEYPYTSRGNPLDFQNGTSPEEDADEGTLNQRPREVDAEVGAGADEVAEPPRAAPQNTSTAYWVGQGVLIFAAVVVVAIAIRFILFPATRIPRIGPPRRSSDA